MSKERAFYFSIILALSLLGYVPSYAQQLIITGRILDGVSGEILSGAVIRTSVGNSGSVTDKNGIFNLMIGVKDSVVLEASFLGYKTIVCSLHVTQDTFFQIYLQPGTELDLITITAQQQRTGINTLFLSDKQLKRLPRTFGEQDALRAFQLMPGVQGGREGTSALYVRGGSPDQNLILLDDVPLYYVNHLGGFLSVFDASAIKNVTLIKGGFPASYGGRLSSVVDVDMKRGNWESPMKEIGIGLLSTKLSMEGPLGKKGKTTYMFSVRRCNFDLFTRLFSLVQNGGNQGGGYNFYDLYGKVTRVINPKNTYDLSLYSGRDKMFGWQNIKMGINDDQFKYDDKMRWGNFLLAFRWNQVLNPRLQASHSVYFTRFFYDIVSRGTTITDGNTRKYNVQFDTRNQDIAVRTDWTWKVAPKHSIQTGLLLAYHNFTTGMQFGNIEWADTRNSGTVLSSSELKYYLMDDWHLSDKFKAQAGLHLNGYFPFHGSYYSMQPRVSVTYQGNQGNNLNASYTIMQQNEHLLSNSGAGLPTDVWVPSTTAVVPEQARQMTLGYQKLLSQGDVSFSTEIYYKTMKGLIDFQEGVNFFASGGDWQHKIVQGGTGEAYGLELMARRDVGKLSGWISYALSYNYRRFEQLNNGLRFPYRYDRRHYINLVGSYDITQGIQLSTTWTFASGDAMTIPEGKFPALDQNYYSYYDPLGYYTAGQAHLYSFKNNFRTPAYHRLDIGANFPKRLKRGERIWNITIYNVYNRQNPYYIYFGKENGQTHLYQFSLFPVMPIFSYVRKW